jgi:large subunit ribosomal protein L25
MKLNVTQRKEKKKSVTREIRRRGDVPAVLYSKNGPSELMIVKGAEFSAHLRAIEPDHLSTTIFTLVDGKRERRVIVKDIQYTPTTYQISHIDFEELIDRAPVSVRVPIVLSGSALCVGVKLGGFLRQVIRSVKVECPPEKIPTEFSVDVADLGIRQTKRLSDVVMPQGVRPLDKLEEVVVVVAKARAS